jgi:hypothetical protein
MIKTLAVISALVGGTLLVCALSAETPTKGDSDGDTLIVFITGNELGSLKPCGCSGGQLGGLDRRSTVLDSIPDSRRLIINTGSFVPDRGEQNLIKFNTFMQALGLLGYDIVNLSRDDLEIARQQGIIDSINSVFSVITCAGETLNIPAKSTRQFVLGGRKISVTVAADDVAGAQPRDLSELLGRENEQATIGVNILIINQRDAATIEMISQSGLVDCIIVPPDSDEPIVVGDPNARPLVISAGRLGKYVGKLQIMTAEGGNRPKLAFSSVAITENLAQNQELVDLYRTYQQLVKDANLLERYPRFALPNGLEYAGSKTCRLCHDYEYDKWKPQGHAKAYATLVKVGSQYDPECIGCHVVGMDYKGGFVSESQTAELKDVGCENCHGPGSEHIWSLGATETAGPMSVCTDCHTPEHSAEYAGNADAYFRKTIHWREPVWRRNVEPKSGTPPHEPNNMEKRVDLREPAGDSNVK